MLCRVKNPTYVWRRIQSLFKRSDLVGLETPAAGGCWGWLLFPTEGGVPREAGPVWIWVLTLAASPATTPSGVAAAPPSGGERKITAARFSGTGFTPTPQREAYRFAAEHAPRRPSPPAKADLTCFAAPLPGIAASSFSATVPPWMCDARLPP